MSIPEPLPYPEINAALNAASTVLLVAGYVAIRLRQVYLHAVCMLAALSASTIFLVSYLYYHFIVKSAVATRFGEKWPEASDTIRHLYYAILGTHTALAAILPVLVFITLGYAVRGRFVQHVRIARWTLPIWLYVSVTGVIVYWMLYRLYAR